MIDYTHDRGLPKSAARRLHSRRRCVPTARCAPERVFGGNGDSPFRPGSESVSLPSERHLSPRALPLESYAAFVRESKLDHTVIIHSEVYQDDHRYLEYCFEHEPSPGFFKGTCLYRAKIRGLNAMRVFGFNS
jgi:hypothetical protein